MRAAVAIAPTATDIVEAFDAATDVEQYGRALTLIGDSARFSNAERGDLARAMTRCWSRIARP